MFNNTSLVRNTVRTACLLAALAGVTMTARAAQAADVAAPSVSVVYARRDLATPQGVQALYARLRSAANQVCPDTDVRDLSRAAFARACYRTALAAAVAGVRKPELTALHAQRMQGNSAS